MVVNRKKKGEEPHDQEIRVLLGEGVVDRIVDPLFSLQINHKLHAKDFTV